MVLFLTMYNKIVIVGHSFISGLFHFLKSNGEKTKMNLGLENCTIKFMGEGSRKIDDQLILHASLLAKEDVQQNTNCITNSFAPSDTSFCSSNQTGTNHCV